MSHLFQEISPSDGDEVLAKDMLAALTAAELTYEDGATQTFDAQGGTTYVEGGRPTRGEWSVVEDGRFSSFWPPSYRATYELRWMVEDGRIVGLAFTDAHGARSNGRYQQGPA